MADQPMNANSLQLKYNKDLETSKKASQLFGDSEAYSNLQTSNKAIEETRKLQNEGYAKRENDRWNKPNEFLNQEDLSDLGPLNPVDNTKPKGDALGDGLGNNIVADSNNNAFKNNATNAAANMYGTNIENSFDREIPPVAAIENNQDITGMNSLYNKTI